MAGAEKLLEDIPNKAKAQMDIMVDVNLHKKEGLDYLEIAVDDYPNPISLRGKYNYRSGIKKNCLVHSGKGGNWKFRGARTI